MAGRWKNNDSSHLSANHFQRSPEDAVDRPLTLPQTPRPARQTVIRPLVANPPLNQSLSAGQRASLTALRAGKS